MPGHSQLLHSVSLETAALRLSIRLRKTRLVCKTRGHEGWRDAMKNPEKRSIRSIKDLLNRLKLLFRRKPAEPDDPYAYRMATLRRPPSKGGAAAVAELDED